MNAGRQLTRDSATPVFPSPFKPKLALPPNAHSPHLPATLAAELDLYPQPHSIAGSPHTRQDGVLVWKSKNIASDHCLF